MMEKIVYYSQGMRFFGERIESVYGFRFYQPTDIEKPVFFQSIYFEEDFQTLAKHKGECKVFWNGSDVVRMLSNPRWKKIVQESKATHYCHNELLQKELATAGITATIAPVFFSNIDNYQPSFNPSITTECYMVAHASREKEYGVHEAINAVVGLDEARLHIYGLTGISTEKILYHGQVPEEMFDSQVRNFHICLRLNQHDGVSQTVMKALLMEHYVVTNINELINFLGKKEPNSGKRDSLVKTLKESNTLLSF